MKSLEAPPEVDSRIRLIRGQRVMLDSDLAGIYGVSTKKLNQAVRRNGERFPSDFMFQLSPKEAEGLRSQIVTSKRGRGGRRYLPYAFTEHGAVMLSSVLRSPVAVAASLLIARAFVRLRHLMATNKALARKLAELEGKVDGHDTRIRGLLDAIRELVAPKEEPARRIGFNP